MCRNVWQYVAQSIAECCSVLQGIAGFCSVLKSYRILKCVGDCRNVLQFSAF